MSGCKRRLTAAVALAAAAPSAPEAQPASPMGAGAMRASPFIRAQAVEHMDSDLKGLLLCTTISCMGARGGGATAAVRQVLFRLAIAPHPRPPGPPTHLLARSPLPPHTHRLCALQALGLPRRGG